MEHSFNVGVVNSESMTIRGDIDNGLVPILFFLARKRSTANDDSNVLALTHCDRVAVASDVTFHFVLILHIYAHLVAFGFMIDDRIF